MRTRWSFEIYQLEEYRKFLIFQPRNVFKWKSVTVISSLQVFTFYCLSRSVYWQTPNFFHHLLLNFTNEDIKKKKKYRDSSLIRRPKIESFVTMNMCMRNKKIKYCSVKNVGSLRHWYHTSFLVSSVIPSVWSREIKSIVKGQTEKKNKARSRFTFNWQISPVIGTLS